MTVGSLLVANRGEVAIRVLRAAAELGIRTVAVYSEDDARCLHRRRADVSAALPGRGVAAYLDAEALIGLAREHGCDAVHPGYGFLSERADFARRCAAAGLVFVGPRPEHLALFGDKARARDLASRCGVPVLRGTLGPTRLEEAREFMASLDGAPVVLKAIAGGGGRGMRIVRRADELPDAFERARSEAEAAFGSGDLYVELCVQDARHVEVQVLGDGTAVTHLWERECTLQRRNQKLVEVAPSPRLEPELRDALVSSALELARETRYESLGTFEFLIEAEAPADASTFAFIEANARLQVEHTVTEEVTGVDLVRTQLELAGGAGLAELGLDPTSPPVPRGYAVQVRVNLERMDPDGRVRPTGGVLRIFEPPSGPGLRADGYGYAGYTPNPSFDPLLLKLVAHSPTPHYTDALAKVHRALCELHIEGVDTNVHLLESLVRHPDVVAHRVTTRFVEEHAAELLGGPAPAQLYFASGDPLAVLEHGKRPAAEEAGAQPAEEPDGSIAVRAPLQGTVVSVEVAPGDRVSAGAPVAVLEAMKMEHVVEAPVSGLVRRVSVSAGDTVFEGHSLVSIEEAEVEGVSLGGEVAVDLERIRPDLAEVRARHEAGLDASRPTAVARRDKTGQRTARRNVEDLCDPGSFVEYGPLVIAAQRRRRTLDDLIQNTPADGLIAGLGRVNGDLFPDGDARCIVMSYDYTVLAGTQGAQNHRKKDRMFELAEQWRLPVVFFTEGGGGRPGDTDGLGVAGLDCMAFHYWGRLSGLVPLVGINSGRCFAGNAAILGCCDVVIATENSNIGMGGPAMIEGGGLGIFRPEEVGPMKDQVVNGVVDVSVADEAEAVRVAKQYLSYFQGPRAEWSCADQRRLRHVIPENRLRVYDMREVISTLADDGSVLELRRHFGRGMVTALARIEGRPLGIVANNPTHLAGAIDSDGADKATRFMQLCDAFDLPILFLCDTPGIMVGPEVEKTALVRHASRMFVTGASVTVPFFTIILRKGYGLGAQAMAGGSFKAPLFTVSWPTGEFGGMGLEGAVKLGFRKELAAVEDAAERQALFQQMVDRMYEHGKAVNTASHFEIDDVIDPADSRRWILGALRSTPPPPPRTGKKRPCIDTW